MTTKVKTDRKAFKTNLKHDDEIIVITGATKGKTGKIQEISRKRGRILIPGINMVKKHRRASQEKQSGEIVEIPLMIEASNVMIFCPECKSGVRIRIKREDKKKLRSCHRCGHSFDKK